MAKGNGHSPLPHIVGTVVRFDKKKKFGFIEPHPEYNKKTRGKDIFFSHRDLRRYQAGMSEIEKGTIITCHVEDAAKGPQVSVIIEIAAAPEGKTTAQAKEAAVKFFNPEKGFGFIGDPEGGKDLFIHHSILEKCGVAVEEMTEGRRVVVIGIVSADKGPKVIDMRLA